MCNGIAEGERVRSKRNILTNNDWEFSNISITRQTTNPGSSENTSRINTPSPLNLHLGISYLKCGKSKTKVFERSQKQKRPYPWRNNNKNYIGLVFKNHASIECDKIFKMVKEKNPPTYKSVSSTIIL